VRRLSATLCRRRSDTLYRRHIATLHRRLSTPPCRRRTAAALGARPRLAARIVQAVINKENKPYI